MKNESADHRFSMAVFFLFALFAMSCSNPLLERMKEKIEDDVVTYVAGEAPVVSSVLPAASAESVPTSSSVSVSFDIDIDASTLSSDTFKLLRLPSLSAVSGSSAYDAVTRTITFTPGSRLDVEASYRIEIAASLKSAKGADLGQTFTSQFTTRYFHDDEIGIALTYSSADLVLNSGAPIYFQVYRVPLPSPPTASDLTILNDMPATASGKYRIPRDRIPTGASQALVMLFHDINGNFQPSDDGAGSGDTERWIKTGVAGNLVEDSADIIAGAAVDGYMNLNPAYVVSVGTGYAVTYTDGSPISADGFESLDVPGSYHELTQGTYETARNLHALTDVDYLTIAPDANNHYAVKVKETTYELRVELYANNSDALTRSNPLASSSGTAARTINADAYAMTGDQIYYLRVDSPSSGLGPYEIGYMYAAASADASESDDDSASAKPLTFGRAGVQTRTFHQAEGVDYDWFALSLEAGKSYMVEVWEQASYFPGSAARGLNADFRLEDSGGSSSTNHYEIKNNMLYITPLGSPGTYYLRVSNETTAIGAERPTMAYTILVTYGPDSADVRDDPFYAGDEYAQWNEHGPAGVSGTGYAIPDAVRKPTGLSRTIYSALDGENPEQDVDWIRIQVNDNMTDYLIRTEPDSGTDGIIVEFDVYRATGSSPYIPDIASGVKATGQAWSGSADEPTRGVKIQGYVLQDYNYATHYPTGTQHIFFVKVRRSTTSASNPLSGAYRFYFQAGADNEDDQYPDYEEPVASVLYGIDETPWMGSPNSTDFSDRNKLATADEWSSGSTPIRYNSIYRKDYDISTGKPDGTAPGADYDFLWAEIPAGMTSASLSIVSSFDNYPAGMPVKATVYKAPRSGSGAQATILARDTAPADEVVTASELVYVGTYDSQSYFGTHGDHQIFETISGLNVAGGDVLFIRVERDDANAVAGDPERSEYFIRVMN